MGISVGIVGVGAFAQSFISFFKNHPSVERIALCDIMPDRLAENSKRHEVSETYSNLDDICKTDLDALAVFTQPWLHTPQVIQAIESGKHAYSAVPIISLSDGDEMLEWCDKLIDACKRTGMRYMMGETSYYRPEAMFGRRQADAGVFGQFVHAEGAYFHDIDDPGCSLREVTKARRIGNWDPKYSGGVPMHYPTHSIGGLLSVMKTHMTKVACWGYLHPDDDWFREDTISGNLLSNETALFHLANGATARICEYRRVACSGIDEQFSVYGTEGSLVHSVGGPHWCTMTERKALTVDEMREPLPPDVADAFSNAIADPYGGHGGSHPYLVHEFVQSILEDRQPAVNAWEAVRYVAPGVVAHKSAMRDGELLEVPDWGDAPQ